MIAYDPHNADAFLQDLDEFGCDLVSITQSARSLNDATEDFRNSVDAHEILHNPENDILTWCFFNASVVPNSFGEKKIDKEHRSSRIDIVDSTIDAHVMVLRKSDTSLDCNSSISDFLKWTEGKS